jgi:acetolactate synthase-1/2/3 large subunit
MPFWPAADPLRLLISNGLATMGFALPAAIAAALARPGPVVCMVGDGGLGMTLAELETVARLDLPITVVVFDDAALSLIEVKQGAGHGGERAVRYADVDFAAIARAMGIEAFVAGTAADVSRALDRPWDGPRLVDARIDPAPYAGLIKVTRG